MTEYHKIESLFEREETGSKKLIEGKFRNSVVEYLSDNEWIFTEKIDGTNIRVIWDGHKITFKGRTDKAEIPKLLLDKLNLLFLSNEIEELFEQKFGLSNVILYGEGYGKGIQKHGDKYTEDVNFILFDVKVGDIYLDRQAVIDVGTMLDLEIVPNLPFNKLHDAIEYVKTKPLTLIGKKERDSEGVIGIPKIRIYDHKGNRIIVKIKVCDF